MLQHSGHPCLSLVISMSMTHLVQLIGHTGEVNCPYFIIKMSVVIVVFFYFIKELYIYFQCHQNTLVWILTPLDGTQDFSMNYCIFLTTPNCVPRQTEASRVKHPAQEQSMLPLAKPATFGLWAGVSCQSIGSHMPNRANPTVY